MYKYLLFLVFTFFSQIVYSQQDLVYDNIIYDPRIKSVVFSKLNIDDRYPIINLQSDELLSLGFDMLGNKNEYFQYTVVHCDANWNPTPMQQTEYIQGMTLDNINDWKFSTNTYQRYVHYNLVLPNDNMKLMIAGNYLLKVFRNFDETDLVLTRRFMVLKSAVTIDAKITNSTLAQYRYSKQEVIFSVDHKGYQIIDPFGAVTAVVMQNSRWDNALTKLKPKFIHDNILEYNSYEDGLYPGGNEFRFFDFRSLRQLSVNVRTKTRDSIYHVYLNYDEERGSKQYFQYLDNNGRRIIDNKDGINPVVDGDYADVNFYLMSMMPIEAGDVYVYGELTDWKLLPEFKMYYNKNRGRYDCNVLLKQGRYEYIYAIKNEDGAPDEVTLEGCHANTENEYLILIYHKNIQFKFDELVGARKFISRQH